MANLAFHRCALSACLAALLCGCRASQAAHTDNLTGDARDRELLKTATSEYLEAKFGGNMFGMGDSLLRRAKTQLEEVLADDAASPKSKREASDMLDKVDSRLGQTR